MWWQEQRVMGVGVGEEEEVVMVVEEEEVVVAAGEARLYRRHRLSLERRIGPRACLCLRLSAAQTTPHRPAQRVGHAFGHALLQQREGRGGQLLPRRGQPPPR